MRRSIVMHPCRYWNYVRFSGPKKNVPGGTDVLGKWKSVLWKITIRALNLQANLHNYIGIKYDKCVNNGHVVHCESLHCWIFRLHKPVADPRGGRRGRSPPQTATSPQKTATPTVFLLRTKRAFFIFVLVKHSRSFNSSSSPHTMPPQLICRCVSSVTLTLLCVLHSTNWLPPVHNYLLIAVTGSHVSLTSFWRFWTNTVNSTCFSQQNVEWTST